LVARASRREAETVRTADTVSRIGGDEFVVVLEGVEEHAEQVVKVADRITESLGAPFALGRGEASVRASIGVAVLDGNAEREAEELVWEADQAMYRAKGEGGARYEFYDGR
jgi:diguanylate cyclase (GGDEF)-like protein